MVSACLGSRTIRNVSFGSGWLLSCPSFRSPQGNSAGRSGEAALRCENGIEGIPTLRCLLPVPTLIGRPSAQVSFSGADGPLFRHQSVRQTDRDA